MSMNEGVQGYRAWSIEQREQRLQRSGLEVALTPASRKKLLGISGLYNQQRALNEHEHIELEHANHTYKAGLTQRSHRQRYRILVYNLTVLEIVPLGAGPAMIAASSNPVSASLQNEGNSSLTLAPPIEQRGVTKLLQELAVRTLYSLGLDSGEVLLTDMGSRRYVVEAITPLLEQPSTTLPEPYRTAAQVLARKLALEQPGRPGLLMGMDPEFLLLRETSDRVVRASRFLPMAGVAGCDAGPPGTRGAFPVAELRPEPRGEPRALLAQLMSAVAAADRLITDRSLRWRAGGMPLRGWALGGHLHFSGVTLSGPLLRALDNYLALPMLLLEDARAGARRPRYGVLGDFRYQPHGGFEYRTLPSFLVSPVVAKGAVYLAHLIVSHYEELPLRPLDREELHAAYYSGDKPPLRAAFTPLLAQLRALSGYEQAARYIEPLFHYIAAERTWDESRDIRELWIQREPHTISPTHK
ncbi:hypothetical protein GJB61_16560 [Paenibacillus sp. LC-T2]|uniref:Phage phiEco32-like COOH-NH2 ligase-type 2 n=1 Tax=Paenibacillus monticola TaxID=2666075 RepID=A0A7X2H6Z3_9BACL|nr:hypothetical protein [Paenibacillus monticola]